MRQWLRRLLPRCGTRPRCRCVPASRDDIEAILIDAFNAADPRQIDGVGGATSTTSKAAVVAAAADADVDVGYLFAQVGIGDGRVEWGSNCGNCATAIALYPVSHGFVQATPGTTLVRMRNLNTGTRLEADADCRAADCPLSARPRYRERWPRGCR